MNDMPTLNDITTGVIVHQVNLRGVMGRGIAKAIRGKWPIVFDKYRTAIRARKFKLGMIQMVQVDEKLWVCNLAGQDGYGHGCRFTDYDAWREALPKLRAWCVERGIKDICFPERVGCVNGGGDWSTMFGLITHRVPEAIFIEYPERS